MKIVAHRVKSAQVRKITGELVSEIGCGLLIYTGIEKGEPLSSADWLFLKLKENLHQDEELMVLSQFTLMAEFKGKKPSFHRAETTESSKMYFDSIVERASNEFPDRVKSGIFGAYLQIGCVFDDPNVELWTTE